MANPTPDSIRAEHHWRTYLPEEYAKIPPAEREAFFARLGTEIGKRVTARAQQMTDASETPAGTVQRDAAHAAPGPRADVPRPGPEPAGYLANLGQMMTWRHEAEQEVLDGMLPAPPE